MQLIPETTDIKAYFQISEVIDWQHAGVLEQAKQIADGQPSQVNIARQCYLWVRDHIKHSWDFQLNPVTCKASDVLRYQTGYCYAKSHLLAALLRANHIPAGFCYQRLSLEGGGAPYCLHGLNAVYLEDFGWYRIDPRGNNKQVHAEFTPPQECLAFKQPEDLEKDFNRVFVEPIMAVVSALNQYSNTQDLYQHLPDAENIG